MSRGVTGKQIRDGTVTGADIANDTLTGADIDESTLFVKEIRDADNNTKVQVEESADENIIRFDTNGTERMVILADGKVGVGTATPQKDLDVYSSSHPRIRITGAANQSPGLELSDYSVVTPTANIYFSEQTDQQVAEAILALFAEDSRFDLWTKTSVTTSTGPGARTGKFFTITAPENGAEFNFSNNSQISQSGGAQEIYFDITNGNVSSKATLSVEVMGNFALIPNETSTDVFDVDADGQGGLETFNLTCNTGSGTNATTWAPAGAPSHNRKWAILNDSSDDNILKIQTDSNTRMVVTQDGKVGIGTTSPDEKLTVSGTLSMLELDAVTIPSHTADYGKLYVKQSDHAVYFKNDSGTEYNLTSKDGVWQGNGTNVTLVDTSDAVQIASHLLVGDVAEESGDHTGIEVLSIANNKNMLRCVDSGGESITSIRKNSLGKTRFQINNSGDENNINEGGLLTVTNSSNNVDPGSTGNPSEAAIFMCGDGGEDRDGATLAWGSRNLSNAGNNSMGAAIKFHNQVEYAGGDLKFYIKKATGAADQSSLTEIMEFQGYGDGSQNQGNVAVVGGTALSNTASGIGYLAIGAYSSNNWGAHTRYDSSRIQCMEDSTTTANFEIQKYGGDLYLGPQSSTYNSGKNIFMSSEQVYIGCKASEASTDCSDIFLGASGSDVYSDAVFNLTTTSDTGGPITFVHSYDHRIARFTSDKRLKLDIQDITGAVEKIEKMQPRSWIPNGSADSDITDRSYGFVAQEMLDVLPGLVTHRNADPETMRGIAHYSMQGWIVAGMKELIEKNKELEARIKVLEDN